MKFYAIKNVEGKWLTFGEDAKIRWDIDCWAFKDRQMADYYAEENGGEIVPLVEKPAPIVVPEWFDDFVQKYEDNIANEEQARFRIIGKICQSGWGTTFNDQLNRDVTDNFNPFDLDDRQLGYVHNHKDELVRALSLNSWVVEKPKLWNVKVPHSTDGYYWRGISGKVHTYTEPDQHAHVLKTDAYVWTQKQIDDAELQDCEKVDVTDDDQ